VKIGPGDLARLFAGAHRVIASRGKKSVEFDLRGAVDWDAVAAQCLGRSGNLKAPTARVGKSFLVAYGEPAWTAFFD